MSYKERNPVEGQDAPVKSVNEPSAVLNQPSSKDKSIEPLVEHGGNELNSDVEKKVPKDIQTEDKADDVELKPKPRDLKSALEYDGKPSEET